GRAPADPEVGPARGHPDGDAEHPARVPALQRDPADDRQRMHDQRGCRGSQPMSAIPMPGLAMNRWGRIRLQLEDAVPLVLFTVFFLGNAVLGYASLRNVAEIQ